MFKTVDFANSNTNSSSKQDKPKNTFWCNVGVMIDGEFIQLPVGIAMDNLKAPPIPNATENNQEFRNLRIKQAKLLEKVREKLNTLTPGERIQSPAFGVEFYRAKEADPVEPTKDLDEVFSNLF